MDDSNVTILVSSDGDYIDGLVLTPREGAPKTYKMRSINYDMAVIASTAANQAASTAAGSASAASQAAASCASAASSANASSSAANQAAAAANQAASAANQAASKAKPYYFQPSEPTREQRVNGMLWLHTNESAKTAVAKRWDARLVGNAIFPDDNTFPQLSAYPDIMGAWTAFSI